MGTGRWGGRASPHIGRDVGIQAQGEVKGTPAFTTVPQTGAIGRQTDGERLPGFKPAASTGGLSKEAKGEVRSTSSKPPGKPGANDKEPAQMATDPPESEAQRRAMGAAMGGKSNLGIPQNVGKEFIDADPGGKLPARK